MSVRDRGVGVEPRELTRIFEMFTQLEGSTPGVRTGLGIGLGLVRSVAELHGGSVEAHSGGPGEGLEVRIQIPLTPVPEAPATVVPERPRLPERRILVIDDNRDAADSLAELLGTLGHDARSVYDGASALRLLEEATFDVVLADLGMPGIDGYELARAVRDGLGSQGPILVALTGWSRSEDRRRSREAGFDGHLAKPVEMETLLDLVDGIARAREGSGTPR